MDIDTDGEIDTAGCSVAELRLVYRGRMCSICTEGGTIVAEPVVDVAWALYNGMYGSVRENW